MVLSYSTISLSIDPIISKMHCTHMRNDEKLHFLFAVDEKSFPFLIFYLGEITSCYRLTYVHHRVAIQYPVRNLDGELFSYLINQLDIKIPKYLGNNSKS